MKSLILNQFLRSVSVILVTIISVCHGETLSQSSPNCPPKYSFHYRDLAHGFSLCLPAKVKKGDATDYPAGSVVFTSFPVSAKRNLEGKQLIIVPGHCDMMDDAAALGNYTVGGVTFKRLKAEEGSAGHLTLHIIYIWKKGTKEIHFDFEHRSVNVTNFDPSSRPAEYDRSAQIKITEEIMGTFKRLR